MSRHRRRTALAVLVALGSVLSSGCGSMTSHMQRVPVTSVPAGASVIVNGKPKGETPVMIWLDRKDKDHVVRIEYPGYDPVEIRPTNVTSAGSIIGNFVMGAALALPIAMYQSIAEHDDHLFTMAAGFGLLFTLVDIGLKYGSVLRPKELSVTLTKANGEPRVRVLLIDAEAMRDITWIRVRRD
jgi:hypothetical protein